ncbi:MAG: GAF domain-containing protein [Candidatus Methanoperedens sp.]|nr:GAF domain-containing protein [Candidatus Methanoperedens sp.]
MSAYFSIVPYSQTLEEQIEAGNLATAKEVSYLVGEHFNWSIKVGNYFVSTPRLVYSVENLDREGITERLALLLASVPDIDRAYITTPEGILWVDYPSNPELWGKDLSQRDWYKGVSRNWQPYVSEVYLREVVEPGYIVSVAIPVKNESNAIGIVVMQHRLETVQKWVAPVRLGMSGVIYVVDKNGRIVAHPAEDPRQPPDYSSVPIVEKVMMGLEGVEEIYDPFENTTMLSAYVPVKGIGMGVVAQQPIDEAFSPIRIHTNLSIILLTLTAIFAAYGAREFDKNKRLYRELTVHHEELEKRTRELSTLYEVDRIATRSLNPNEVLTSVLAKLLEVTGVDSGDIYVLDESSGELILKGQKGLSDEVVPLIERLKIGDGVAGACIQQGDIIIINDIELAPAYMTVYARKTNAKSLVSIPIRVRERILGVLDLVSHSLKTFSREEIELLESIADQIGIAVENASLYENLQQANLELERRLKELEEFYEIAVGRELRMVELKKEIEELRKKIQMSEGNV